MLTRHQSALDSKSDTTLLTSIRDSFIDIEHIRTTPSYSGGDPDETILGPIVTCIPWKRIRRTVTVPRTRATRVASEDGGCDLRPGLVKTGNGEHSECIGGSDGPIARRHHTEEAMSRTLSPPWPTDTMTSGSSATDFCTHPVSSGGNFY